MTNRYYEDFDTHTAVKRLIASGLASEAAEAIVNSISAGRRADLSHLVTKEEFFAFKEEHKDDILSVKNEIQALKSDMDKRFILVDKRFDKIENDMELFKKDVKIMLAQHKDETNQLIARNKDETHQLIAKTKNETIMWIVGLFTASFLIPMLTKFFV